MMQSNETNDVLKALNKVDSELAVASEHLERAGCFLYVDCRDYLEYADWSPEVLAKVKRIKSLMLEIKVNADEFDKKFKEYLDE